MVTSTLWGGVLVEPPNGALAAGYLYLELQLLDEFVERSVRPSAIVAVLSFSEYSPSMPLPGLEHAPESYLSTDL